MLKLVFWLLLTVNAVLFALGRGYLGNFHADAREPERLKRQLNSEKLTLVPASAAAATVFGVDAAANPANPANPAGPAGPASPAAAAKPAPKPAPKPELFACTEIGTFVLADARRFEAAVNALDLGDRQSRRNVPGQDISSYLVHIPPQGSKEAADKKASELKQLGVSDFFIMSDNTPLRWAISLGVFKQEAGAQNLLAALAKQGVHSARVSPRYSPSKLLSFQFRDLDRATRNRLEQIKGKFPEQDMRSCK